MVNVVKEVERGEEIDFIMRRNGMPAVDESVRKNREERRVKRSKRSDMCGYRKGFERDSGYSQMKKRNKDERCMKEGLWRKNDDHGAVVPSMRSGAERTMLIAKGGRRCQNTNVTKRAK